MSRRHRRSKVTRVVNLIRRIIAFFFSHVGLSALVVGYACLGAVVFRAVEGPHEEYVQREVLAARHQTINVAWNATFRVGLWVGYRRRSRSFINAFQVNKLGKLFGH